MARPGLNPYREKIRHRAGKIAIGGIAVSALCSNPPRTINLKRASWVLRDDAVTCPRCRALIDERQALEGKQ